MFTDMLLSMHTCSGTVFVNFLISLSYDFVSTQSQGKQKFLCA